MSNNPVRFKTLSGSSLVLFFCLTATLAGQNLQNNPALSEIMQVAGVSRSGDDGYAVQEFLTSRAAMHQLDNVRSQ